MVFVIYELTPHSALSCKFYVRNYFHSKWTTCTYNYISNSILYILRHEVNSLT